VTTNASGGSMQRLPLPSKAAHILARPSCWVSASPQSHGGCRGRPRRLRPGRQCDDLRWRVIDGVVDNARMKLLLAFVQAAQVATPSVAPRPLPPLYRAEPVPCERFLTLLERHLGPPKISDPIKNWAAKRNELTASIARLRAGAPLHGSCRSAQEGVSQPRRYLPPPPPQR